MDALPLIIYEYLITIDVEVERFWVGFRQRPPWAAFLFFINRYVTILGHIPIVFEYFWYSLRPDKPQDKQTKTRRLRYRFSSSKAARLGSLRPCLAVAWIGLLGFDCAVFGLTVFKTLTLRKTAMHGANLLNLLLRDGTTYFGVMIISNIANMLSLIYGQTYTRGVLTPFTNIISSILISRLMLNLRGFTANQEPLSPTTPTGAMTVPMFRKFRARNVDTEFGFDIEEAMKSNHDHSAVIQLTPRRERPGYRLDLVMVLPSSPPPSTIATPANSSTLPDDALHNSQSLPPPQPNPGHALIDQNQNHVHDASFSSSAVLSPSTPASTSTAPSQTNATPIKTCSSRGCTRPITCPNSSDLGTQKETYKMCEPCRAKHRVYASTKRAKRRREKEALLGIYITEDESAEDSEETPRISFGQDSALESPADPLESTTLNANTMIIENAIPTTSTSTNQNPYITNLATINASWDPSKLDPRLLMPYYFSPGAATSSSSALVGALGPASFPLSTALSSTSESTISSSQPLLHPYPYPYALVPPASGNAHTTAVKRSRAVPVKKMGRKPKSKERKEVPEEGENWDREKWRLCTVRGCIELVMKTSEHKMCDDCRARYQKYGITKRKKAKRMREEEDRELVAIGLGIAGTIVEGSSDTTLTKADQDKAVHSTAPTPITSVQMRMCTVSHCRVLLPVTHPFKRCDFHMEQNRHHSRLNMARRKERREREKGKENVLEDNDEERESESDEEEEGEGEGNAQEDRIQAQGENSLLENEKPSKRWKYCDVCRARKRLGIPADDEDEDKDSDKLDEAVEDGQQGEQKRGKGKKGKDKTKSALMTMTPLNAGSKVASTTSSLTTTTTGNAEPAVNTNTVVPPSSAAPQMETQVDQNEVDLGLNAYIQSHGLRKLLPKPMPPPTSQDQSSQAISIDSSASGPRVQSGRDCEMGLTLRRSHRRRPRSCHLQHYQQQQQAR
ncbi:hypothetical protein H0H93_000391 [Arthromyces matolae]|nr:hypothetical protein H0H93_000391 [Arthromyces matolae]